jgi:hypothetical protein
LAISEGGAVHDLPGDSQQVPVRRRRIHVRWAFGSDGLRDFVKRDRADQHAFALDHRKIRQMRAVAHAPVSLD